MPDWPVDKEEGGVVHQWGGGGGCAGMRQRERETDRQTETEREQFKALSDTSMQGS